MKLRIAPVLLALVVATLGPVLAATTADAANTTRVTAVPSTPFPAAGFVVPIRGKVSGPPRRQVLLLERSNGNWYVAARRMTRANRYVFRHKVYGTVGQYRVVAPATPRFPTGSSARFQLTPVTATKPVARVFNRKCVLAPEYGKAWKVTFTAQLLSGERWPGSMIVTGFPYLGVMTTSYGGSYNIDASFQGACGT